MSTRRLIITAMICGLAILVAGGIQLIRISRNDQLTLPTMGEWRTVSGVEVAPVDVAESDGLTIVTIRFRTSPDVPAGPIGEWTLVRNSLFAPDALPQVQPPVSAELAPVIGTGPFEDCATQPVEAGSTDGACRLAFDAPGDTARYLAFARGGVEARWALDT
ncbi:MAG: hypothetical protein R2715_10450 [Ilumatobacteraceae bacterium]